MSKAIYQCIMVGGPLLLFFELLWLDRQYRRLALQHSDEGAS